MKREEEMRQMRRELDALHRCSDAQQKVLKLIWEEFKRMKAGPAGGRRSTETISGPGRARRGLRLKQPMLPHNKRLRKLKVKQRTSPVLI